MKKIKKNISGAVSAVANKAMAPNMINRVVNIEHVDGETSRFEWLVGSLSKYSLGDKVTSSSVTAGGSKWVLDFYPRGYVMPDHASLYLNVSHPETLPADWSCHVTFTLSVLNPGTKEVVEKASFSKLFNREVHSWGKNNFISIKGMLAGQYCVNDTIMIGAEISSVKEVAHDIEDWGIMPDGRHRFVWKVQNYKSTFARLKTGQKISSASFSTGDLTWFLDLYPNGYKNPNYIALYLHSGASSKEARSARVPFSLLVFDNHAQQFVTCANLCQTFDKAARCWGKHSLKKKADVMAGDKRLVDNNMLCLAVDIALMKDNFAQAKRYLWVPLNTANRCRGCQKSMFFNAQKVQCHYTGEVFCGKCCKSKIKLPEFGYKEEVPVCDRAIAERHLAKSFKTLSANHLNFQPAIVSYKGPRDGFEDFEAQAYGVLWEPEPVVFQCRSCFKSFGFFRRKHHCRSCGMIFCSDCTGYKATLPELELNEQVRMCQNCFHARKASNARLVPVTPKAEKKGMNARGRRKKDAKDVDDEDMSKLRMYCPFMYSALQRAGRVAGKKKDKKKPVKGDDDFDSDDEEAEMLKKKKEKARAKAKAAKKKGSAPKVSGTFGALAKSIKDVLDHDPKKEEGGGGEEDGGEDEEGGGESD
mmetsp:Transcript_23051/g.46636  ORF Transcript_23051/g.46636 Transcript_23051/m.46636 type:complete len:643 (-) Transcript_23051:54-1982(-)